MLHRGMPLKGRLRLKKKVNRGRILDYDRLCALLGRSWDYITPEHFYNEMDMFDISKLVPFIDPALYSACWVGHDRADIDKLRKDGVIRGQTNG